MNVKNYYQCCAVPSCRNTTIKTPTKLFIHVPVKTDLRHKWLKLALMNIGNVSVKSNLFFCEDHFDLPNDMENYMEYHLLGSVKRIIMKPTCLPSKFACHHDRKKRTTTPARETFLKRQRKELVEQLLRDEKETEEAGMNSTHLSGPSNTDKAAEQIVVQAISGVNQLDQVEEILPDLPSSANKLIQVYINEKYDGTILQKHMTSPLSVKKVNIAVSPLKKMPTSKSGATRKLNFKEEEAPEFGNPVSPSMPDSSPYLDSASLPSDASDSTISVEEIEVEKKFNKQLNLQNTLTKIKNKSSFYIGVPKSCYCLINIIEKHTSIPEKIILLCLKKIRLNTKFEELADEFGITKPYAYRIFIKKVPIIADLLLPFVVKFDHIAIKLNLPTAFRHKGLHIIGCLETEIEKPSKTIHQALTWSQYKKSNTLKYLISCTPDGLVNYISPGYGGRISDIELVDNCGFLDNLPPNTDVLADIGFTHLEPLLLTKGFNLLRQPSVLSRSKLSKQETKEQEASLTSHAERVIRRVREFTLLKPHAVISSKLIHLLDEAMTIACALINLQNSIIKK